MRPQTRTAGVPIRYTVTAVVDVYYVGLTTDPTNPGALVSPSALLPEEILRGLDSDVQAYFIAQMTKAVTEFTRRNVERTDLAFVGVASQPYPGGQPQQEGTPG